jgi:hypothetical protein
MPSTLYQSAVASLLEDERESLSTFETWLPERIRENLRSESHLVGDHPWGHDVALTEFLRQCAREHGKVATDPERQTCYEGSCTSFEGKGLRIERDHLPGTLLRYSRHEPTVLDLIERVLTDRVKQEVIDKKVTLEEAFVRLGSVSWDPTLVEDLRLGGGAMVFATFEHPAGAPRNHAGNMAAALALPPGPRVKEKILVEFSYPTGSVSNHRFPTVADAGWVEEFQPAPEVEPDPVRRENCHGWTRPLDTRPRQQPQPELVHENGSLRVLDGPPRFVGRYVT